jgi:hypothetical protein
MKVVTLKKEIEKIVQQYEDENNCMLSELIIKSVINHYHDRSEILSRQIEVKIE